MKKHRTILPTSIHAALGFGVCLGIVIQVRPSCGWMDGFAGSVSTKSQPALSLNHESEQAPAVQPSDRPIPPKQVIRSTDRYIHHTYNTVSR